MAVARSWLPCSPLKQRSTALKSMRTLAAQRVALRSAASPRLLTSMHARKSADVATSVCAKAHAVTRSLLQFDSSMQREPRALGTAGVSAKVMEGLLPKSRKRRGKPLFSSVPNERQYGQLLPKKYVTVWLRPAAPGSARSARSARARELVLVVVWAMVSGCGVVFAEAVGVVGIVGVVVAVGCVVGDAPWLWRHGAADGQTAGIDFRACELFFASARCYDGYCFSELSSQPSPRLAGTIQQGR